MNPVEAFLALIGIVLVASLAIGVVVTLFTPLLVIAAIWLVLHIVFSVLRIGG